MALEHYATLSEKCSMTPLLWLQYAQDTRSMDDTLSLAKEIVQLALEEFPGCVLLNIYYLDCCCAANANDQEDNWNVWNNAMKHIKGLQSSPHTMIEFYRLAVKCFPKKAQELFIDRAHSILQGNESIVSEMQSLELQNGASSSISAETYQAVEQGRKFVSQNMSILNRFEEDVAVAMTAECLDIPPSFSFPDFILEHNNRGDDGDSLNDVKMVYDWDRIITSLGGIQGKVFMGYGMMQTAQSFMNYVFGLFQHIKYLKKQSQRKGKGNDKEEQDGTADLIKLFSDLIVPTYERAISECPTVEILWEKYTRHLTYVLHDDESTMTPAQRAEALIQLKNVSSRAVKNCPYSVKLFTMKMQVVLEEVEAGRKVLEPDDLMNIVEEAVKGEFLPDSNSHLQVYLSACRIVKRRIMDLVSKATSSMGYDESERLDDSKKKRKKGGDVELKRFTAPLEEDVEQEVQDLIEDLREMYDAADGMLRKKYSDWTEGRYILYREKARVEAYICSPLVNGADGDDVIKCFEKLVRVHQPPHPDAWREYIQYMMGKSFVKKGTGDDGDDDEDGEKMTEVPGMVIAKFRFVRNMYQRALSSMKKANSEDQTQADFEYDAAMRVLCQEFQNFETAFGSDQSSIAASKLVSKKLESVQGRDVGTNAEVHIPTMANGNEPVTASSDSKRKRDDDNGADGDAEMEMTAEEPNAKKPKSDNAVETAIEQDMERKDDKQDTATATNMATANPDSTNEKKKKKGPNIWPIKPKPDHMVKVGKMEYPAHPFTVHVSNLSSETLDMDLYDLFRSKCGAIVHAKIFREKQHDHGTIPKSKCAALIQFEERESVEEALKLSGEFGLHEKLIVVARSHQPAVGVCPPGMHRLNPKGQGKHTKHNVKRKERRDGADASSTKEADKNQAEGNGEIKGEDVKAANQVDVKAANQVDTTGATATEEKVQEKKKPSSNSILAFRPRNVAQKQRKKKIGL